MKPHSCLILVEGDLRSTDREWLADMAMRRWPPGNLTALTGGFDKSGLYGVLNRLQYLALEIVEVRRLCGCLGRNASVGPKTDCRGSVTQPRLAIASVDAPWGLAL